MRRPLILVLLGVLVIVGAWYMLLWGPANRDLKDAQDRQIAARNQLSSLESEINTLIEMEANRPELQSELEALRAGVPATPDEAEILLAVRAAAEASGVTFPEFNASPPIEDSNSSLGVVQIELAGTGGYFQILDFLNRLMAEHRILVIDRVSLNAAAAAEDFGPPSLTWQLSVRAFVQPGAIVDPTAPTDATASPGDTTTTAPGTQETVPADDGATGENG